MPNGFSVERMLELVLEGQNDMARKIDEIQRELSAVNANGCAKRENDIVRLTAIEQWKEFTTKSFIGVLFGTISALALALYNLLFKH